MPSLLNMIKARSGSRHRSDDNKIIEISAHPQKEQSRARPQIVKSTPYSAAYRGLYATPTRRSTSQQRSVKRSAHFQKSGSVNGGSEYDDPNDPIIKSSIYPQMVGKRRSELEACTRTRSTKYDRASTGVHRFEETTQTGRLVRRQQLASRMRSRSAESDFSFLSGYDSDRDPEGRSVRLCMYPRAKYFKEPIATLSKPQCAPAMFSDISSSKGPSSYTPSLRASKCSSLPGEEYQSLVRRQKMQRACEVLEPHFAHYGSARGGPFWHWRMQNFTIPNSERRRLSKTQYAVRKALQADLDLLDDDFRLALNRHADKVYFCELSDVDGLPIAEPMVFEFVRLYQEAQDAAYAPKLPDFLYGEPV